MAKPFKWKAKDGQVYTLDQMTISHLQNTIHFLSKKMKDVDIAYGITCNGDAASYHMDQAITQEEDANASRAWIIGKMVAELAKRGIKQA